VQANGTQEERLRRALTRREFLKLSGAGVAGASLLSAGCGSTGVLPDLLHNTPSADRDTNVVLIIMDSLRKDHVGAYGNDKIQTPNLDALAKDSLLFTRAYPESAPTICARRAIHTGLRTWPFEDWRRYKGIDVSLQGWQPIPNDQITLAETMRSVGYETLFVTDNLQQYDASMNFQRGFEAFDFIRGQTTDSYRPLYTCPPGKVEQALVSKAVLGPGTRAYFQRYFANTAYRDRKRTGSPRRSSPGPPSSWRPPHRIGLSSSRWTATTLTPRGTLPMST
jgi:Sulfatase